MSDGLIIANGVFNVVTVLHFVTAVVYWQLLQSLDPKVWNSNSVKAPLVFTRKSIWNLKSVMMVCKKSCSKGSV